FYSSTLLYSSYTSFSLTFFYNDTAPTDISTLSLHDALPISHQQLGHYLILQFARIRFFLVHIHFVKLANPLLVLGYSLHVIQAQHPSRMQPSLSVLKIVYNEFHI